MTGKRWMCLLLRVWYWGFWFVIYPTSKAEVYWLWLFGSESLTWCCWEKCLFFFFVWYPYGISFSALKWWSSTCIHELLECYSHTHTHDLEWIVRWFIKLWHWCYNFIWCQWRVMECLDNMIGVDVPTIYNICIIMSWL